ncbi:MAG: H-NS family nucleoid-associated regulatory protein [Guyparkeria sp.]|uniref:H-NS histone family protein n=1 Tax=Guyparkeria sp. TaxID=2035736 RepID=UPI00397A6CC1
MSQIDVKNLSADELKKLVNDAEQALRDRNKERVMELRREAEALAAELNTSVAELFGLDKPAKQAGKKLPPKYINPANPSQTWSGRGKRPNWLVDELNKGKKLEDFQI